MLCAIQKYCANITAPFLLRMRVIKKIFSPKANYRWKYRTEFCNLIFVTNRERRHKFLQNGTVTPHPANLQHFISAPPTDNLSRQNDFPRPERFSLFFFHVAVRF